MSTRYKAATVTVKSGNPEFTIYGPPDTSGHQPVINTMLVDIGTLPADVLDHCRAVGFATIAQSRYTMKGDDDTRPDVAAEVNGLLDRMRAGQWHPGRDFGPKLPSVLVEALANLTGQPVHLIQEQMQDKTTFTKAFILKLRADPPVAAEIAKIEKARATAAEAAAKAAGKAARETVNLGALFGAGQAGSQPEAQQQAAQ